MTQNAINNSASEMVIDNLTIDLNTISSTDTNGDIILAPDGAGTVSVTTAPIVPSGDRTDSLGSATNSWDSVFCNGVTFDDGTNTMSAYEEGTWTPVLQFGGGTTGITYGTQTGVYTRIGRALFYSFDIVLTSKGSDTGIANVAGLPFTVSTAVTGGKGHWGLITLTANYTEITSAPSTGTTTTALLESGNNVALANLMDTSFGNTTLLVLQGYYFI